MLFTEPSFLFLFLPILLALYFGTFSRTHGRYGNWLLLVASVIFYAKGGGTFTWLMLGSIAFNYWMAIAVDRARTDVRAAAQDVPDLRDYREPGRPRASSSTRTSSPTTSTRCSSPPAVAGLALPRVLLPIGISFYTFHAISYVVDVYRRDASAQKSPVHAALYLLLFPQLIAGPIIRYRMIADQLACRTVTLDDFATGVRRFIIGLGKKVLIANIVAGTGRPDLRPAGGAVRARRSPGWRSSATRCRSTSTSPATPTWRSAWAGCSASGFRRTSAGRISPTRCRSSGGAGTFRFPAGSATICMCRSAATASPPAQMYRNLVTVFFLCGLWHGASWNFVIWGLFHGSFLVVERLGLGRLVGATAAPRPSRLPAAGRDGRLGVLPGGHAAVGAGVPPGDVRPAYRGSDALRHELLPHPGVVACLDRRHHWFDADRLGPGEHPAGRKDGSSGARLPSTPPAPWR